jgi:enoyl-CoA hydratase/carnithine racemase
VEHIRYEVDGPIGVITLDRTEKANAVDQQALDELNAAFEEAAADREVRVIVLRAEGKHFCSGHDITASNAAVGREAGAGKPGKPRPGPGLTGMSGAFRPSTSGRRSTTWAIAVGGATSPSRPSPLCRDSALPVA